MMSGWPCVSGGGPGGLQDDAGHDAGVGDHRQVRGAHFGDVGVRVLGMASCNASGMAWSAVPTTAQDGMVFQAGTPDGWVRAIVASGAWSAARTWASRAGNSLAMHDGNALWVM